MKIINACIEGFKKAYVSKKIITIIYGSTLLIGLILAWAFKSTFENNFSSRLELYKLLNDFDFRIYSDFMNNYGDRIYPFVNQIIWFGAFYFFFTVFFAGGVLKFFEVSSIKSKAQTFFAGCAKYFFRFLRLGIYVLLIQFAGFVIIALIFSMIFANAVDASNERTLFTIIIIGAGLYAAFFILISVISDYAKIILVKDDSKKIWHTLLGSLKFAGRRIYVTYPLYILLLTVPVALSLAYLWLDSIVGMTSVLTVFIMVLIQQLFIWSRLFSKIWILGSEYEYFNNYLVEKTKPLLTQEMLLNESL